MRRIVIAAAVFAWAFAAGAENAVLVLQEEAYVKGPRVLLSDVATIDGSEADALGRIELASAARPGGSKQVNAALVEARLRGEGYDLDTLQIQGARSVKAVTLYQDITAESLAASLEEFVLMEMPWDPMDAQVQVSGALRDITAPEGAIEIEWKPSPAYAYIGSGSFSGTLWVDGEQLQTVLAKVNVEAYGEVVVAARDVSRGQIIGPADVELRKEALSTLPDGCLWDESAIVGQVLKRSLFAGQPFTARLLDAPQIIERNQVVPIELNAGGLRITTRGRALADARVGDMIACANEQTKSTFQGRVREDGTVVID